MAVQRPYREILISLSKAKVRYLVAGGIAMNIHGLERATHDIDFIIFLEKKNILRFISVMKRLGYRPKIPVKPEDFADEKIRETWIKQKNMVVFSYYQPKNPFEVVDVFVYHPRPFPEMFKARKGASLSGFTVNAVGLKDMLFLKEKAGRPKDEMDIRYLRNILRKKKQD